MPLSCAAPSGDMLLIYNPPSGASWKIIPMPARFSLFFFLPARYPYRDMRTEREGEGGRREREQKIVREQ